MTRPSSKGVEPTHSSKGSILKARFSDRSDMAGEATGIPFQTINLMKQYQQSMTEKNPSPCADRPARVGLYVCVQRQGPWQE